MISFGICTYNRKDILLQSIASLKRVKRINTVNIRVYDDCSTEYDELFLKNILPFAKSIQVQKYNCGADKNTSIMYEDFLETDDDYLFNADSDLLYSENLIDILEDKAQENNGFFSVFNTLSHQVICRKSDDMLVKNTVGAAGCFLDRNSVEIILSSVKQRKKHFDINMCVALRNSGKEILVTEKSYVQHIGVTGYNSDFFSFDYGVNFQCDSITNGQCIENAFEKYTLSILRFKKSKVGKFYNILVKIYRKMLKCCFIKAA